MTKADDSTTGGTAEPDALAAVQHPEVARLQAIVDSMADDGLCHCEGEACVGPRQMCRAFGPATLVAARVEIERMRRALDEAERKACFFGDYVKAGERLAEGRAEVARLTAELESLADAASCAWCDDTGIAPSSRFGRDQDGAPWRDDDGPCPKGCEIRPDIQVLINEARGAEAERDEARAELARLTAERDKALTKVELLSAEDQSPIVRALRDSAVLKDQFASALGLSRSLSMDELIAAARTQRSRLEVELRLRRDIEALLDKELGVAPIEETSGGYFANIDLVVQRGREARAELAALRASTVAPPRSYVIDALNTAVHHGRYGNEGYDVFEAADELLAWRAPTVGDTAPTRDEVIEEFAATWDGVDRTAGAQVIAGAGVTASAAVQLMRDGITRSQRGDQWCGYTHAGPCGPQWCPAGTGTEGESDA